MWFFQNGITCINPRAPTPLMAYWRKALSTSISPNTICVSSPARVDSYWIWVSRRRRSASSGTKRASRADISRSQRAPSAGLANTNRAGLALFTELRITDATSSDKVSSRCAPARASTGESSKAPPTSSRRRSMRGEV